MRFSIQSISATIGFAVAFPLTAAVIPQQAVFLDSGGGTVELVLGSNGNSVTVPFRDYGWVMDTGEIGPQANYLAGYCAVNCAAQTNHELRNWFLFDIPLGPAFTSAIFRVTPAGISSFPGTTETYTMFDASSSSIPALISRSGGLTVFEDLGSGTSYGIREFDVSEATGPSGPPVEIALNADALSALNSARGDVFGFGGAVTTISAVPEPGTSGLLLGGVLLLVVRQLRARRMRL